MFKKVNSNKNGVIEYSIDNIEDLDNLPRKETDNTVYAILNKNGKRFVYLYSKAAKDYILINGDLEEINEQLETNTSGIKDISINVKSFGAKGDGITDDTQAIQSTLDYVGELGGGTVFLPKGIYSVRIQSKPGWLNQDDLACIYLRYSNITLKGDGVGKTIIKQVSYNGLSNETDFIVDYEQNRYYRGNMFKIGTKENPVTNNITIENIEFDGGCPNLPSDGLNWGNTDITNGSGWDVSHKCLYYLNYGESNRCDNFNIHDNLFRNFRGEVIYGGGNNTGNVNIYNNKILNSVTGISGNGHFNIYNNNFENILINVIECLITAGDSLIHSNTMLSSGCAINIQSHSVGYIIPTVKIYDNHIENINLNAGIYLAGAKNVEVYNNTILDSNKGIWITDFTSNALNDGLSRNITIKQNKIGTHKNANVSNPNTPSNTGIHTICDSNRDIVIQDNIFYTTDYASKNGLMLERSLVMGTIRDDKGLILRNNIVLPNSSYHGCPISDGWFDLNSSNSTTVYYQGYLMADVNETLDIDAKYYVYRPIQIEVYGTLLEPSQVVITIQYQNKLNEQKTEVIYDKQVDTMFSFQHTLLALLQGSHSFGSRMELNIRVDKPNIAQIQYSILQK